MRKPSHILRTGQGEFSAQFDGRTTQTRRKCTRQSPLEALCIELARLEALISVIHRGASYNATALPEAERESLIGMAADLAGSAARLANLAEIAYAEVRHA